MSSIAFWIGVIIFGLGAIFGLLSAIRTLQISRRWSDYRLRQRYIVQARGSVLLALLSGSLALALLVLARSARGTRRARGPAAHFNQYGATQRLTYPPRTADGNLHGSGCQPDGDASHPLSGDHSDDGPSNGHAGDADRRASHDPGDGHARLRRGVRATAVLD